MWVIGNATLWFRFPEVKEIVIGAIVVGADVVGAIGFGDLDMEPSTSTHILNQSLRRLTELLGLSLGIQRNSWIRIKYLYQTLVIPHLL